MNLEEIIQRSPLFVMKGRYAMVSTRDFPHQGRYFFAYVEDDVEKTVITEEKYLDDYSIINTQKWFILIRAEIAVSTSVVGFLSAILSAIAKIGLSVLVISTFSYDYLLINEEDIDQALLALKALGFRILYS